MIWKYSALFNLKNFLPKINKFSKIFLLKIKFLKLKKKYFNQWCKIKKQIELKQSVFCKLWEVWMANIWENIWDEESWKWKMSLRPVFIYKKFNNEIFLWILMTSKLKNNKFHYPINVKKEWRLIFSQIRLFSTKRLDYKIWSISKDKFFEIKEKLINFLNE